MAGWYIRRGEKVVGPVGVDKLKELVAAGRLVSTDQLAKDAAGPWTQAARTSLFAGAPSTNSVAATPSKLPTRRPAAVPATVHAGTTSLQERPQTVVAAPPVPTKSRFAFLSLAGSAVARGMAERSRRKHELKLAKIQAQVLRDSQRSAQIKTPQSSHAPAPQPQQAINVNVVQQVNSGGGKHWSRLVAMILSLIIPGLGQLYKGQPINGLAWFLLTMAGYFFFVIPGLVLHCFCVLGAAMGDPYR